MLSGRGKKVVASGRNERATLARAMARVNNIQDPALRAQAQSRLRQYVANARSSGPGPALPSVKQRVSVEPIRGSSGARRYTPDWS